MTMNDAVTGGALCEFCDYLAEWTMQQYEQAEGAISPEVKDRCVSTIGIAVPLMFTAACLAFFVVLLARVWRGVLK